MERRSYRRPSSAVTGSSGSSQLIGQRYSSASASMALLYLLLSSVASATKSAARFLGAMMREGEFLIKPLTRLSTVLASLEPKLLHRWINNGDDGDDEDEDKYAGEDDDGDGDDGRSMHLTPMGMIATDKVATEER